MWNTLAGLGIIALAFLCFFAFIAMLGKIEYPLRNSWPYSNGRYLREDNGKLMVYTPLNPNLTWWQKLYLPLNSKIDEYWVVMEANDEEQTEFERMKTYRHPYSFGGYPR